MNRKDKNESKTPCLRQSARYDRQKTLLGEEGQEKLSRASVFIAGAGGLGSPVATYLAAAGVGKIVLLDCDTVERTNLNRQFLHHEKDIGKEKAISGAEKLNSFNPEIQIMPVVARLEKENISELAGECQIIVDALDNNETRRLLAAYAFDSQKPYIHAAVSGFQGQLASFYPEAGPCFFCAFPESEEETKSDAKNEDTDFPIIGATAGIIGAMQANEVIKYISSGKKSIGKLFVWDGKNNFFDEIEIEKEKSCPICGRLENEKRKE